MAVVLGMMLVLLMQSALAADKIAISQIIQRDNEVNIYLSMFDQDGGAASDRLDAENVSVGMNAQAEQHPDEVIQSREGVAYAVCVDVSASITKAGLEDLKSSLSSFVDRMGGNDYLKIITIGETVKTTCDYTTSRANMRSSIDALDRKDNKTHLLKGLTEAMNGVRNKPDGCPARDVIIVFTDGGDDSDASYNEAYVTKLIEQTRVPLYFIGLASTVKNVNLNSAGAFADQSNGRLYSTVNTSLTVSDALRNITDVVNNASVLVLYPDDSLFGQTDISWHVNVSSGGRNLRSNEYKAPLTKVNVVAAEPEPEPAEQDAEDAPEDTEEPETLEEESVPETAASDDDNKTMLFLLIIGGAVLLITAGMVALLFVRRRRTSMEADNLEQMQVPIPPSNFSDDHLFGTHDGTLTDFEKTLGMDMGDLEKTIPLEFHGANPIIRFNVEYKGHVEERQMSVGAASIIGKSPECALKLDDQRVSRRHAQVSRTGDGRMCFTDLRSMNGTTINGSPIQQDVPTPIRIGDKIKMGETTLTLIN